MSSDEDSITEEPEQKEDINIVGRWTKVEEKYIKDNYKIMSIDDISKNLKRNPETIKKYIKTKVLKNPEDYETVVKKSEFDIKKTPLWGEIVQQLTTDEQDMFIYNWVNIMTQFKNDVFATERMQIIDVCRNEILISRSLKRMKQISVLIDGIKSDLDDEKSKPKDKRDVAKIIDGERMLAESMSSAANFTREYKELLEKKTATLKEIKGTREQRIKRVEESRESITSWMSNVIGNPEKRRVLAVETEKFRLAVEKEKERLSEYYKFGEDIEQPILNADTIKDDNL